jgi:hypothetical protein
MRKITDLSHYRNKKLLMNETKKVGILHFRAGKTRGSYSHSRTRDMG